MEIKPLHLTKEDIDKLKRRHLELGRGTDGIVYKTGNIKTRNILYKIYLRSYEHLLPNYGAQQSLDENGVKIIKNKEQLRNIYDKTRFQTCYIDSEGVKINGVDAIYKAIERQKYVTRTKLQQQPIYIDNHFGGTVLYYHRNQLPMYLLKSFPRKTQIKVLQELLLSVEELLENNIYHIDLGLQAHTNYKKANVLISRSPNPHPNIIDIDGKSAIYTETFNQQAYQQSLRTYKNLMVQILFDIDPAKLDNLDYFYFTDRLAQQEIDPTTAGILLDAEQSMPISDLGEFLQDQQKIKKKSQ